MRISDWSSDVCSSDLFEPLKPYLAKIDALKSNKDIPAWLNQSFAKGDSAVFRLGARADYKNAKMQIAYAVQGGLGLPTPDYYTDAKYKDVRAEYVKYLAKLFELTGDRKSTRLNSSH